MQGILTPADKESIGLAVSPDIPGPTRPRCPPSSAGSGACRGIFGGKIRRSRRAWHDEFPYVRLPSTFTHVSLRRHGDPAYMQVMRCTYDRNGAPTTVTHIFVRMGE